MHHFELRGLDDERVVLDEEQKAAIRKQLRKAIKKNPAVLKRRSFVRKAALVNFVLLQILTGPQLQRDRASLVR